MRSDRQSTTAPPLIRTRSQFCGAVDGRGVDDRAPGELSEVWPSLEPSPIWNQLSSSASTHPWVISPSAFLISTSTHLEGVRQRSRIFFSSLIVSESPRETLSGIGSAPHTTNDKGQILLGVVSCNWSSWVAVTSPPIGREACAPAVSQSSKGRATRESGIGTSFTRAILSSFRSQMLIYPIPGACRNDPPFFRTFPESSS